MSDSYCALRDYDRASCLGKSAYEMGLKVSLQYATLCRDLIQTAIHTN